MTKKFLSALAAVVALSLTACSSSDQTSETESSKTTDVSEEKQSNKNSDETVKALENLSQLEIGMSESDVNDLLGDPSEEGDHSASYYSNKYLLDINGNDCTLSVSFYLKDQLVDSFNVISSNDSSFREAIMDEDTDLSSVDDVDSGDISTYDEVVKAFKTSGTVTSDNGVKTTYLWVDSDGGYMSITFDEDGNVSSYSGFA